MATKYLESVASGAAASYTGGHMGVGWDKLAGGFFINPDGTRRRVALTSGAGLHEVVTATNTLTAEESGKTCYLDAAAGFVTTLPAAALGLHFTFIVKTSPTSNGYTITGDPADVIYGTVAANGAETIVNGIAAAAADNVILVHNQSIIGDRLEFVSDGTNWYVSGHVNTFAALTANG
jgi:hypothetical protein